MTQITSRFTTLASTTLLVSSLALLSACGGGSSGTAATDTSSSTTGSTTSTGDTSSTTTTPTTITPAQAIDVAGKVFVSTKDTSKGLLLLNAGGNGTAYTQETGKSSQTAPFTWNLNSADLTLAFAGSTSSFKVAQDSSTLTMTTDSTNTFTQSKPLTLAALNGKHISFDMTSYKSCTAMTISFSGAIATVRDNCNGKYEEVTGTLESVVGVQNLVKIGIGTSAMLLALASGDVSKGRMVRAVLGEEVGVEDITTVSAPLQP